MQQKILSGLKNLGYSGPLLEEANLTSALQEGPKNVEYTKLVNFLTNELRTLLNIDEEVNFISSSEDAVTFVMELSSFLKELNCMYTVLTQGHISDRLQNIDDRVLVLDYLMTEVMAGRILQEKKPNKKIELKLHETDEAASMRKILMTLRFPKPPVNVTVPQLFQKLCPTVQNLVQKVNKDLLGKPAFSGTLSDKQWQTLDEVHKNLQNEYKIRREMLLTRLDVTIQSFQWSDRTKGKDDQFEEIYAEKRKRLKADPDVSVADLLAAREDIAIIEKTSNSQVRKNTQSSLNKVIIGEVPDRGGRTSEQAPPPPEMPSWQQRSAGPGRGRGRGGGGNFSQNAPRGGSYSGNNSGYSSYSSNSDYKSQNAPRGGSYSSNNSGYSSSDYKSQNAPRGGSYSGNSSGYSSYSSNKNDSFGQDGSSYQSNSSFDSAGSYSTNYGRDNNSRRDSYENKRDYEQTSKRPKTYDSFQVNRTSYSDQYVQEEQHNQQYHEKGRNSGRGRGQSNYKRGGRGRY